ncbi:MAG: serine racemase VanT catalytic subunit [Acetatifactor muris]|nr:serine racemase VanT catalytic subunit [Acetatifactor muris]MCM1525710.1 serine racemase VanT catalytic subunit [Bacteroides sp.]
MSNTKKAPSAIPASLGGLDLFGLFASLCVIAIHTSPLTSFSGTADLVWTRILARVAVPFFLMRTGYFLQDRPLLPFLGKLLRLYGIAVLLYLPVNLYAGHFQGLDIGGYCRILLFDGTFYHLWYLPACLTGVCAISLLLRRLSFKAVTAISLILYGFGLLGDSYYGLTQNNIFLQSLYEILFSLFSYTRNGIFYAPIFLIMGIGIRRSHKSFKKSVLAAGLTLSLTALCVEGFLVHHMGLPRHDSMYVSLLPCMYFLFRILLTLRFRSVRTLRGIATCVYVIHPLCIVAVRGAAKLFRQESLLVDNSLLHYLAVCILSLICATAWGRAVKIARILWQRTAARPAAQSRARNRTEERQFVQGRARNWTKGRQFAYGRAWIELDMDNLRANVAALQSLLPEGCQLMPVVKANAYGHGAVLIARELNRLRIRSFAVASLEEGVKLRRHGIRGEILILGYTHPRQFPLLRRYRLTQTLIDRSYAELLNAYGRKIKVHVKIDTGMRRLGERCENREDLQYIYSRPNLIVTGTYTHLCADEESTPRDVLFTKTQAAAFYAAVANLEAKGFSCGKIHLLASYGLLRYPQFAGDYARTGIALYGVLSRRKDLADCPVSLAPVLSVKARVALIKELYAGESAGYGLQYTAPADRRIAVLSIGYADGIPRSLSCGKGHVLIRGHRAPIIGCICMDQTLVDVTAIPDVSPGDTAVLIGVSEDQEISAYDLAEASDTITNELLSRLGSRLTGTLRSSVVSRESNR